MSSPSAGNASGPATSTRSSVAACCSWLPAQFEHRRRRIGLAVRGVRDHPRLREFQCQQLVFGLGEPGREQGIVKHPGRCGVFLHLGEAHFGPPDAGDAGALVAQQEFRVRPALILFSHKLIGGHANVGEEQLVDLVAAIDRLDRAAG